MTGDAAHERAGADAAALDALVDDEGRASFPASDPPSSWSGVGDPVPHVLDRGRRAVGLPRSTSTA